MRDKLKIAILGTRGIPNKYGGFEQFAEYVSTGLVRKGHNVTVYNPHFHKEAGSSWEGVNICHKYCPEDKIGASAHFIYDYLCLRDALKKDFDFILECGYGTSALSYIWLPTHKTRIITNMDGVEWKRSKYPKAMKRLMMLFERVGVRYSDHQLADNRGIKKFLGYKYGVKAPMIPYGANIFDNPDPAVLAEYDVEPQKYFMLIARLEPANNVEMILDGYDQSSETRPFLVVGNHNTEYGEYYKNRYEHNEQIKFLGPIYDKDVINNLRYYSTAYFHGHSVGGTNPSLLEAMACSSLVIANNNVFNRSVLQDAGLYFNRSNDITHMLNNFNRKVECMRKELVDRAIERIQNVYHWDIIVNRYEQLFRVM